MKIAEISSSVQPALIHKVLVLRGLNIWSSQKVLECWVQFPSIKQFLPSWKNALFTFMPEIEPDLNEIGPSPDKYALATLLKSITLHLQKYVNPKICYGKVAKCSLPETLRIIIEYDEEEIGRSALDHACHLLEAGLFGKNFNLRESIESLRELAHQVCLGPSTIAIVEAALARGIPVTRLTKRNLVQLGWGSRQKKILASATSQTSALSEEIVQDKEFTRLLLDEIGLTVPRGRYVVSPEDAWAAALEIGVPVAVKPRDGNQGRGVILNLSSQDQVVAAYELAQKESESIIVEQYIFGETYRLLVVGENFVAASHCRPPHVAGDGIQTIQELVDEVNLDPRRACNHAGALSKLVIDNVALGVLNEQGVTPNSIPLKGQIIQIRRNGNLSTGGTAEDVTDLVHPSIRAVAIEAAKTVGLDVCGIDIVAHDISQPLSERNGVFIELNARPGLRMHLHPSVGKSRPVGKAIVDSLFAPNENGRIPIIAVTGVNGKTTTTRFITHLLSQVGWTVGTCNSDGIFVGDRILDTGDCSGPKSAHVVLGDPFVDVAVLETARGGILREGVAFDYCDVAVATNIGLGDHLGIDEINTPEELAIVKQCIFNAVPDHGTLVVNATDPLVVKMADMRPCRTIFFAPDSQNELIRHHRHIGERAVFVREGHVILAEGESESVLLPLAEVLLTQEGKIAFQIENTLAAIAASWALDINQDLIRQGARSFTSSFEHNPGRFNVLEFRGVTIVVDYGHNIDALRSLLEALRLFNHLRRLVAYSSAGNRRDCDIIEQGRLLGAEFDEIWLYEGEYVRGRQPGEIMELIALGLKGATRTKRIEQIQGHRKAIGLILEAARPGDLVMIQADVVGDTVKYLKETLAEY